MEAKTPDLEDEVWKKLFSYSGYEVSDKGRYGLSSSVIQKIKERRSWKHVM